MSNEITLTASLSGYKPSVMSSAVGRSVTAATFTMTGTLLSQGVVLIGTSATAVPLGQVTTPHWTVLHNLDITNFLTIRNGAAGADLLKLLASEWAFFPMHPSAVPYGVADTAAILLEFLIFAL